MPESVRPASTLLQELFDKAPLPYQSLDAEGRFLLVNQAWTELLGYAADDVLGRVFTEILDPASQAVARERFATLKREGQIWGADFELIRKDGAPVDVEVNGTVATDDEGRFVRTHCILMDVSERKRAQRRLQESERQYRTLVELAHEGVWQFDAAGRTVFVNPALTRMLGYEAAEMTGRPLADFTAPREAAKVDRLLAAHDDGHELHDIDLVARDGRPVHAVIATRRLRDGAGERTGILAGVIDMTERRRFETRLLHAQKLESLTVMAGGIAHDFNNLLQTILGNADLALLAGPYDLEQEQELRAIETAAHQAAGLCRQMLAYAGRGEYVLGPVRLDDLVSDIAPLLRATVTRKAELRYKIDAGLPDLQADAAQLRQVLVNLVANAAESLDERPGTVTITARSHRLDADEIGRQFPGQTLAPGVYVVIGVRDSGCGISPETTDLIFDPFFTTKFAGRGLGLAVVRGVACGHGGTVNVTSTPGLGTTVEVWLPAGGRTDRPAPAIRPVAAVAAATATVGRVLVAEDEAELRNLLIKMCRSLGWEAVTVPDGAEAVHAVVTEPRRFDLAILDWSMPVMDGREALERISAAAPALPVFLSTGHDEESLKKRVGGLNPAGFLAKPYRLEELRRVLTQRAAARD